MSFTSMSPRLDSRWSGSFPLPGRELHPLEAPGFAWRTEHLREVFGGHRAETITADAVRRYQLHRRKQGAEAATINRETSALSRMLQLAIRRGLLERMPLFPNRLAENPPREGFFEHDEYLKVRAHAPASYQDVLDFAYYSGWRRTEILELTWDEVDLPGEVIRLPARGHKTRAVFDRYNIVNEQELLTAGQRLAAYLAKDT